MTNRVLELWKQRLVVIRPGVYYHDGTARSLKLDAAAAGGIRIGDAFDPEAAFAEDEATSVDAVLVESSVGQAGRVLCGGECDFGSDGYFALLDADRSLLWLAFFEYSNPFVAIDVRDAVAVLRSSDGTVVSVRTDTTEFVPAS